jgi:hypothetical protein
MNQSDQYIFICLIYLNESIGRDDEYSMSSAGKYTLPWVTGFLNYDTV